MSNPFWPKTTVSGDNPFWPLPYPDSLGGIIGADDVRDAVKATILEWSPFYLFAISGRLVAANKITAKQSPLPNFGKWVNDPTHRNLGTGEPAAFLVTVPATVGTPFQEGDGAYKAVFRSQVEVAVFGTSWEEAADRVSWYEKVVRACVIQHKDLGNFAMGVKWAGVQYSGEEHTSSRTVGIATLGFDVTVADVIDAGRGPATVPDPFAIPAQDPTVESVLVTVAKETS